MPIAGKEFCASIFIKQQKGIMTNSDLTFQKYQKTNCSMAE